MKEMNVISKLLRKKDAFYDDILSNDTFWLQTLLGLILSIVILFIYATLVVSNLGWEQALISGLKYVILFIASIALCFPTFYVFSSLRGSALELKEISGLFVGFLLYISLILIALVPVNWLFAFSGSKNGFLSFLFMLFSTIALFSGFSFLNRGVKYLNEKLGGKLSGGFLFGWSVVFILVLLQMSANLGPWFDDNRKVFREDRRNFLEIWNSSLSEGHEEVFESINNGDCPSASFCSELEQVATYKEYVRECGCYIK